MAKLIYSMIISLDGYAEAAEGDLGTGADDQEVHTFVNDLFRPIGTYLYGRRIYETMVYWETAHTVPDQPPHILQYARDWQAAEKIVYSTKLESVSSAKTTLSPCSMATWAGFRPPVPTVTFAVLDSRFGAALAIAVLTSIRPAAPLPAAMS